MEYGLIRTNKGLILRSLFILSLFIQISCEDKSLIGELIISEPTGIARELEYIEVELSMNQLPLQGEGIFIRSEKNAYIIFRINPENPAEKIREVYTKLTHPILVNYNEL